MSEKTPDARLAVHEIRERLTEILQAVAMYRGTSFAEFSSDEETALMMASQLLQWAATPPERVEVIKHKAGISFGEIHLGDS